MMLAKAGLPPGAIEETGFFTESVGHSEVFSSIKPGLWAPMRKSYKGYRPQPVPDRICRTKARLISY